MDGGIAVTKVDRLHPLLGFAARNGSKITWNGSRSPCGRRARGGQPLTELADLRHEAEPSLDAFGSPVFRG
jgi:hypothetical protein